ncbi:unnamed protein product [Peronospora farinosa]|uniref:PSI domain-containing protein n=1 Tax=Peronospora farinosa TaxID=134698 RepID=A0ABN8CI61_9STRA|nr:unnamed protein product [Peronospora farinosa]
MDCATISWSGTQRQAEVLPPVVDDTDRTQGICSYDPLDTRGCQTPRSCYDCLNAEVEKESGGCMINDIGRCISVADCSLDVVATIPVDDIAGDLSNNGSIDNVSEKMEPLTSRQTITGPRTVYVLKCMKCRVGSEPSVAATARR